MYFADVTMTTFCSLRSQNTEKKIEKGGFSGDKNDQSKFYKKVGAKTTILMRLNGIFVDFGLVKQCSSLLNQKKNALVLPNVFFSTKIDMLIRLFCKRVT